MRKPAGFHAGRLNVSVSLLKRAGVTTGEGGFQKPVYETMGPRVRWAEWQDAGARDIGHWQGGTTDGVKHDARLIMRRAEGIDSTCRVTRLRDDSLWAVINVKDYYGGGAYMELTLQRADEGGLPVGY